MATFPVKTINLPFRFGNKGFFETTVTYEDALKLRIRVLLSTEPGTRLLELDYGAGLKKFLFEPNDEFLENKVKSYLQDKFKKFLPELLLKDIKTNFVDETLYVEIFFILNGDIKNIKVKVQ
jgi:phage baseplate assembly protein W